MPNFRYQSSDYMNNMRRGNFRGPNMPQKTSCQPSCETSCEAPCRENPAPVCCNDKAGYDELRGMPVAMAYVPWQEWCSLYEADKGFHRGTIFEELDKPFRGIGGCCK